MLKNYEPLKKIAEDYINVKQVKIWELAELYIEKQNRELFFTMKKLCLDPRSIMHEILEKAEEYIPDELKEKYS